MITSVEKRNGINFIIISSLLTLLTACSDKKYVVDVDNIKSTEIKVERSFDFAQLTRGGQLFQKNCARCHGIEAQGAANWQQADADGKYPPPLNGSAHAWHHSARILKETIKKGTRYLGGNMPAWEGRLTDRDIEDIIVWFQSKWSDEIYAVWHKKDQDTRP